MKRTLGIALVFLAQSALASGSHDLVPVNPPPAAPAASTQSTALALAALDRRIADLDAEEEVSKRELSELGTRIAEAHARTLLRGRAFYRLTRAGMLPVGGGFDALVTHALRVERARRSLATELTGEKKLRERGVSLSRGLERIARDRVALSSQRTAMDAARLAIEDENRRQMAFDRAFSTSSGSSEYVAVYGANGAAPPTAIGGFASSKGRLLFPLAGRSEVRPAKREGTDGPGLEIKATMNAPVRAVFGGRIAFADRYGPYGRLVIVDHGEHYYTVSGNLAAIEVKVGDEVSAGERLGTVGDEGRGPMLYFEIRHATQTMPPAVWLGL
ncbi:MAG: peptidoglycan DD-metalloendopeptidase family protein [Labilithrix sp.]|nr:peptidoglycan DD-metalloendopeptidase family protein [Labilithrix sp.]MCW5810018.1 peptidoglycan DD-metalloendopeptidase family protein [Labilithrix sp.]